MLALVEIVAGEFEITAEKLAAGSRLPSFSAWLACQRRASAMLLAWSRWRPKMAPARVARVMTRNTKNLVLSFRMEVFLVLGVKSGCRKTLNGGSPGTMVPGLLGRSNFGEAAAGDDDQGQAEGGEDERSGFGGGAGAARAAAGTAAAAAAGPAGRRDGDDRLDGTWGVAGLAGRGEAAERHGVGVPAGVRSTRA